MCGNWVGWRVIWIVSCGWSMRFLRLFDDCYARSEGREHLRRYVRGQLSNIRRKCVEPMADALGVAPRTLQDFLTTHTWDWQRALDRLQELVAQAHLCEDSIGLIDENRPDR